MNTSLDVPLLREIVQGGVKRHVIASSAKAHDYAACHIGKIRMVAERLAGMGVGKVQLDERECDAE